MKTAKCHNVHIFWWCHARRFFLHVHVSWEQLKQISNQNRKSDKITHNGGHCIAVDIDILTHWGRVTHICVNKLTIIGSDNVLSPGRRQAIIWTNAGILLVGPLGTNFSEILIEIRAFSFKKMHLKVSSGKRRPFYLGLNVLTVLERAALRYVSEQDGLLRMNFYSYRWLSARLQ